MHDNNGADALQTNDTQPTDFATDLARFFAQLGAAFERWRAWGESPEGQRFAEIVRNVAEGHRRAEEHIASTFPPPRFLAATPTANEPTPEAEPPTERPARRIGFRLPNDEE